jgi:hypothetical protein
MPIYTSHLSSSSGMQVTGSIMGGITMNNTRVSVDSTIPSNNNALLYGPITVEAGATLTVGSNANLKIKDISDA